MITFLEAFKNELEMEAVGTRKMLALVPADKMDWAPHEKSMKMKALATHIADLPQWISMGLTTDELDFEKAPYNPKDCNNGQELVDYFNANVADAIKDLEAAKEEIERQKEALEKAKDKLDDDD